MKTQDTIVILDFGSQYTQLITRSVREQSVYSLQMPWTADEKTIREICPYCNRNFKIKFKASTDEFKGGLMKALIKPHDLCHHFYIFVDVYGSIRGYQIIDEISASEPIESEVQRNCPHKYDSFLARNQ